MTEEIYFKNFDMNILRFVQVKFSHVSWYLILNVMKCVLQCLFFQLNRHNLKAGLLQQIVKFENVVAEGDLQKLRLPHFYLCEFWSLKTDKRNNVYF